LKVDKKKIRGPIGGRPVGGRKEEIKEKKKKVHKTLILM